MMKDSNEKQRIERRIIEIITQIYRSVSKKRDIPEITAVTDIRENLGFDSLMLIILQVDVEDTFHIHMNPIEDDFQYIFKNIQNLSNYVQSCLEDSIDGN